MASEFQLYRGVIHESTIELQDHSGLPDGQEVTVTVQPVRLPPNSSVSRLPLPQDSTCGSHLVQNADPLLGAARK